MLFYGSHYALLKNKKLRQRSQKLTNKVKLCEYLFFIGIKLTN
ncbi:unknown [[Mannheimia] succiniciproducens MBEL55E]|uniref:Uncharacterized protein n=1 Tax=Mannheimia succiniciproducens (strain KCTC 0769BP / MBEL55E) TaxID=221988 RepID=Q65R21_MANSM|nr:unknown [[Mannheimia] succiniciproducens MBEL55E]